MKKWQGHRLKPQLGSMLSWMLNEENVVKEKGWYAKQNYWKWLKHKTYRWENVPVIGEWKKGKVKS